MTGFFCIEASPKWATRNRSEGSLVICSPGWSKFPVDNSDLGVVESKELEYENDFAS